MCNNRVDMYTGQIYTVYLITELEYRSATDLHENLHVEPRACCFSFIFIFHINTV